MVRVAFSEKCQLFQIFWPWLKCVSKKLFWMLNVKSKNVTIKQLFWESINLNRLEWVCYIWLLTRSVQMFWFYTPLKTLFFWCFMGYKMGTWGKKFVKQHSIFLELKKLLNKVKKKWKNFTREFLGQNTYVNMKSCVKVLKLHRNKWVTPLMWFVCFRNLSDYNVK